MATRKTITIYFVTHWRRPFNLFYKYFEIHSFIDWFRELQFDWIDLNLLQCFCEMRSVGGGEGANRTKGPRDGGRRHLLILEETNTSKNEEGREGDWFDRDEDYFWEEGNILALFTFFLFSFFSNTFSSLQFIDYLFIFKFFSLIIFIFKIFIKI